MILGLTREERQEKGQNMAHALGDAISRGCTIRHFDTPKISRGFDEPVTISLEMEVEPDTQLLQDIRRILWERE